MLEVKSTIAIRTIPAANIATKRCRDEAQMSPHSGKPSSPTDRISGEQIAALYRNTPLVLAGSGVTALILVLTLLYRGNVSPWAPTVWIAVILISSAGRLQLWRSYRQAVSPVGDWRRWARRFFWGSVSNGLTWGFGALWLLAPADLEHSLLILFVLGAMGLAAVYSLGSYLPRIVVV